MTLQIWQLGLPSSSLHRFVSLQSTAAVSGPISNTDKQSDSTSGNSQHRYWLFLCQPVHTGLESGSVIFLHLIQVLGFCSAPGRWSQEQSTVLYTDWGTHQCAASPFEQRWVVSGFVPWWKALLDLHSLLLGLLLLKDPQWTDGITK